MTWRTRLLIVLAALVAAVMTWLETRNRPPRRAPEPETIEVEIITPEGAIGNAPQP